MDVQVAIYRVLWFFKATRPVLSYILLSHLLLLNSHSFFWSHLSTSGIQTVHLLCLGNEKHFLLYLGTIFPLRVGISIAAINTTRLRHNNNIIIYVYYINIYYTIFLRFLCIHISLRLDPPPPPPSCAAIGRVVKNTMVVLTQRYKNVAII